jgi:hypothetical protein
MVEAKIPEVSAEEFETGVAGESLLAELNRIRANACLDGMATKIDSVIDLATSSPDCKDLLSHRLGRLRDERREVEGRLRELVLVPARVIEPEAVVDLRPPPCRGGRWS